MRWFLDTEFAEDGTKIDLISLALVAEPGHFYYACSTAFNPKLVNDWVRDNVLPKLPPRDAPWWKSRTEIADDVRDILLHDGKPELWGYFADYDWVALCQLYGRMVDLPKGFPFWCHDLKQLMEDRGVDNDALPFQTTDEHDALNDARWIRSAWLHLKSATVAASTDLR